MKLQKYKHSQNTSYAFGATLTIELLKTQPELIKRVFLRPVAKHGEDLSEALIRLNNLHIEVIESTKAFNILGAKDNCLLIAEFEKPHLYPDPDSDTPHIVLVNPSDAGNLGTIIRTAAAFNIENIAIITPAVDPYDPKTVRASMGAIFHVNLTEFASFDDYIAEAGETSSGEKRQLFSFQLDPHAAKLSDVRAKSDYALIFGNEATGLPKDFAAKYNTTPIFIPQSEMVDSLNLSVAAGIAMHYFSSLG